jgi:N-acetylmuramoyl-L-alanine amidase
MPGVPAPGCARRLFRIKTLFCLAFLVGVTGFAGFFGRGALAQGAASPPAVPGAKPAEPPDSGVLARAVHLVDDQGAESVGLVVDLSSQVRTRVEALADPPRLVIDLEGTRIQAGLSARGLGPVSAWRAGLFMLGQSRIVLDLARPALIEQVDFVRQAGAVRLVAQVRAVPQARFDEQARADQARRLAARPAQAVPLGTRQAGARPLLVLDPGHGGLDPGASGSKGESEKELVLAVAKALRRVIEADARIEVQMTREDDRFIPLAERVAFARSKGAALFVSLHADSLVGEAEVRGASVYTLGDRASDADAARAAEKENRADQAAGLDLRDEAREGVDDILFDLARRETRLFSQIVARSSASALQKGARLHKTPLRSGGFRVLRAPDMPSILIELGYLSNPEDVAILAGESSREKLAQGLGEALVRFLLSGRDAILTKAPD